jgi:hypothetical protein
VKYKVYNLKRDLVEINRQLAADKDSIRVLKAEWAYLNKPERIQQLSAKYLKMDNIQVANVYKSDQVDNLYVASMGGTPETNTNTTKPVLKPILSSARGYR